MIALQMNTDKKRANKARLDNRWGCCVGHALRNYNLLVSTPTPAPAVPALNVRPRNESIVDAQNNTATT